MHGAERHKQPLDISKITSLAKRVFGSKHARGVKRILLVFNNDVVTVLERA